MNIQKLTSFLALAEYKSFSVAAEKLYRSQPNISMQIQSLENDLGVKLFDRIGKRTYLTIQGETFKQYAEEMINLYKTAKEQILQLENINSGTINLGSTNFNGVYFLPLILSKYKNDYPNVNINLTINSSKKLLEMLKSFDVEFILLSDYIQIDDTAYNQIPIKEDPLYLVVSSKHPLYNKEFCHLKDLENEQFIFKSEKSSLFIFLKEQFKKYNFSFKNNLLISNQEGIKQAIIHDLGVSIMSKTMIENEIKLGLLKPIEILDLKLSRKINLIYDKKRTLTPASKKFFDYLK